MERLTKLPTTYPYTNKHGVVYTKEFVDTLVSVMRKGILFVAKKSPSDHNLTIVISLIKHLNNFNPMTEDLGLLGRRASWFASLIVCRQMRSFEKKIENKKFDDTMFHYTDEYSIDDKEDPKAESDIFEKLFYDDVRRYVGEKEGGDSSELVALLYQGYTSREISKLRDVSIRTTDRKIKRLLKLVTDYMNKREVDYSYD